MDALLKDISASRYSFLWQKHKNLSIPANHHFNAMQQVIPEPIVRGKVGLDLGCGCGWDTVIMAKNNPDVRIIGIDISDGVYGAFKLSNGLSNISILKGSAEEIPLKDQTCDFVYSFGVLHHTPNYGKSFIEISRILRRDGLCLLYLYEDHSENIIKYRTIKILNCLRHITVRMLPLPLYLLCCFLAPFIFTFFSLPSKVLRKFELTKKIAKKMPFNFAASPFALKGDLFDRFSAPVEHRFSRQAVYNMFVENGFYNVNITRLVATAGWVACGYRK